MTLLTSLLVFVIELLLIFGLNHLSDQPKKAKLNDKYNNFDKAGL